MPKGVGGGNKKYIVNHNEVFILNSITTSSIWAIYISQKDLTKT